MPKRRVAKGAARSRAQIAAQQKAAEASARKRRKRGGDEPSARRAVARLDTNAPNNKKDIVALKEATKGGTAKGKVSLAASAKVGRENVINDADRIAYRAAAAESRKLKVTLGDNAPTPDKIFSTAKKIAKIRAGDDEVKVADIKKASLSLDPDEKTPEVAKKVPLSERTLIVNHSVMDKLTKKNQSAQEKMVDPENVTKANKRVADKAAGRERRNAIGRGEAKPRTLTPVKNSDRNEAAKRSRSSSASEERRRAQGQSAIDESRKATAKKADLPDGKIAPEGGDLSGPTRVQVNGFVLSRSGAATFRQDVKQANGDPEKIRSKAKERSGELRKALEAEANALGSGNSFGNDTPDGDADGTNDNRPNGFNSSSMDAAIRGVAKVKQTDRYVRTSDAELADKIYEMKELMEKARAKLGTSNLSDMAFTAYRETLEDLVAELRVRKSGRGKAATGVKQPPVRRSGRPER